MTNYTQTLDKLRSMRLFGMESAFQTMLETKTDYTMDELVGYLAQAEWENRQSRKVERHLKGARFRYQSSIEEIDFSSARNLNKNTLMRLADCTYIRHKENIIITGSTGTGKSFLATALGRQACFKGFKTLYFSMGKLFEELHMSRADASRHKLLRRLEKAELLILDDFGLWPLEQQHCLDLMEIIEDRHGRKSMIIAAQIPVSSWYDLFKEKTIADAILDRLVHSAHRVELKGESMRKLKVKK